MDEKLTFKNTAGEDIAAVISAPEKANGKGIVLLHCFTCTKHHRIIRGLAECLVAHGFTVLRFDFSGNGESGGRIEDATYTKMVGEARGAVSLLRRRGIGKIGVAGHSMGAMLSLISAHEDKRISAVGFIAGSSQAARVREVFPKEAVQKAETEGSAHAFIYGRDIRLRREFLLDVERFNVGHYAATLRRPLLIVHGTADEIIPPFHARQLYAWASEPKTLEWIDGADHLFQDSRQLDKLKVLVCSWFAGHL